MTKENLERLKELEKRSADLWRARQEMEIEMVKAMSGFAFVPGSAFVVPIAVTGTVIFVALFLARIGGPI